MAVLNLLDPVSIVRTASSFTSKSLDAIAQTSDTLQTALAPLRPADLDKNYDDPQSRISKLAEEVKAQIKKGPPMTIDVQTISAVVNAISNSNATDDRKMLLEHVFTLMARLPSSIQLDTLQHQVISLLYNDLPHPQTSYLGNKYAWRSADGSGNNPAIPDLGKSNTPYARSVQSRHPLPRQRLPDASLLFDTLLRRDRFVPHPAGISSMLFAFASLIVHSVFHTSHTDWSFNAASSYLDLSPLYGSNQKEQDAVRKKDGYGMLQNDVFSENRVLFLPPAAAALLVVFNRNHQYIARKLFEINERGTFADPSQLEKDRMLAQDDEIFNIARLINCGHFVSVILGDYLSCILGSVREGSSFSLQPFDQIRKADHSFVGRATGNVCSVEFNMLYRWHACISQVDEKWTESVFMEEFQGMDLDKITIHDFTQRTGTSENTGDVTTWTFGRLRRQPNGMFKDEDLGRILQDATQHVAGAFKAQGVPSSLRIVEIMGIEQARAWGVCTLNEFRKFLLLKPYSSFTEWNSDPEIAEIALKLYGHIDNLELYVGLHAEESKPVMPGSGLCPGFTISRAILSDAVSLTRGDRYFTTDYTPFNLTAWGFADTNRDTTNPGFGSHLGRLLLRTLGSCYTYDSTYTWFPFSTPEAMKGFLTKLELADKYDFARPATTPPVHVVNTYGDVSKFLQDTTRFRIPCVDSANSLIQGRGYLLSLDEPSKHNQDLRVIKSALFQFPDSLKKYQMFFHTKTKELIQERSFLLAGNKSRNIDIVRDVLNIVPLLWVSTEIVGLPLKTKQNSSGALVEQQLIQMLREIFSFIFLDIDPAEEMRMEERAQNHTRVLLGYIKTHLNDVAGRGFPFRVVIDSLSRVVWPQQTSSHDFYERLYATGRPLEELANDAYSIMVLAGVEVAQALVHVVNFYLDENSHKERENISVLAQSDDRQSEMQLEGYVREALRIDPPLPGVYRDAKDDHHIGTSQIKKDERLFLNIATANLDPSKFPSPTKVNPERPKDIYLGFTEGIYGCFGDQFVLKIITQVLRVIFSLKNVRRAVGQSGTLKRSAHLIHGTRHWQYLSPDQHLTPWALSMLIQYDE